MEQRVNPCRKDCQKRAGDCHVWCEKYRAFRAWKEEEYAERAARAALDEADAVRGKRYGGMYASVVWMGPGGGDEARRDIVLPGMWVRIHLPRRKTEPALPAVLPKSAEKAKAGGTGEIEIYKNKRRRAEKRRAAAAACPGEKRAGSEGDAHGTAAHGETGGEQKIDACHDGGTDEGPCGPVGA